MGFIRLLTFMALVMVTSKCRCQPQRVEPPTPKQVVEQQRQGFEQALQQWIADVEFAGDFTIGFVEYANREAALTARGGKQLSATPIATGLIAKDSRRVRFQLTYTNEPVVSGTTPINPSLSGNTVTYVSSDMACNDGVHIDYRPGWTKSNEGKQLSFGNTAVFQRRRSLSAPQWSAGFEHSMEPTPITPAPMGFSTLLNLSIAGPNGVVAAESVGNVIYGKERLGLDFDYRIDGRNIRRQVTFLITTDPPVVCEVDLYDLTNPLEIVHGATVLTDYEDTPAGKVARRVVRFDTVFNSQDRSAPSPPVTAKEFTLVTFRTPSESDFQIKVPQNARIHGLKRRLQAVGDAITLDPDSISDDDLLGGGEATRHPPEPPQGVHPAREQDAKRSGWMLVILGTLSMFGFSVLVLRGRRKTP